MTFPNYLELIFWISFFRFQTGFFKLVSVLFHDQVLFFMCISCWRYGGWKGNGGWKVGFQLLPGYLMSQKPWLVKVKDLTFWIYFPARINISFSFVSSSSVSHRSSSLSILLLSFLSSSSFSYFST